MGWQLYQGDCLEVMQSMPDNSVNLIATDPPYFKVKNEAWDRQWDKPEAFLEWIGKLCEQWHRILKPNGSLYVFASPRMAARVECKVGEWFEVMNRIRWVKGAGWHNRASKEQLRSYLSPWEEIIFSEHYGADNIAKGEAGYGAKCDELKGFVFEPLREYLAREWERAGLRPKDVNKATYSQMAGHYLTRVQWALPTKEKYEQLRAYANRDGGDYLQREHEDLRREYDCLRRPFNVTADVPYTDVWDFPTVKHYPGKHPCEKPLEMMEHIVKASSRERDVVLDCFAGSGVTGEAALKHGRDFIGIEMDKGYCARIRERLEAVEPKKVYRLPTHTELTLFDEMTG